MNLPASAGDSAIRVSIQAGLGDVDPLITIEAAASASSQHLMEDTARIIRNLVMAGLGTGHCEDLTVQILMFGRAIVLECQVFGFGPVQLPRGSDRHHRMIPGFGTLSNLAACLDGNVARKSMAEWEAQILKSTQYLLLAAPFSGLADFEECLFRHRAVDFETDGVVQ